MYTGLKPTMKIIINVTFSHFHSIYQVSPDGLILALSIANMIFSFSFSGDLQLCVNSEFVFQIAMLFSVL